MEIRINTDESGPDEFTALIALFASLGGRLPNMTREQQAAGNLGKFHQELEKSDAAACAPFKGDAPAQIAETAETTATPIREGESLVDSKGTPWDARIHSESRATVADGTWRKRRGVSDELFNEVMGELKAAALVGHPDEDEAPPPPPADEPTGNDVPAPPAPTAEEPSDPAPVANAPAAGDGQFADFPAFVGAVSKHGKTYAELNEMAGTLGVPMFKDMKDHADKWDIFFSMIG